METVNIQKYVYYDVLIPNYFYSPLQKYWKSEANTFMSKTVPIVLEGTVYAKIGCRRKDKQVL